MGMGVDGAATVWVVDDDRSMRWVLERALGRAGFAIRSFARGDRALESLATARPDAVVSDIRMPGADGLALLAAVRAEWPALPVIVITAHSDLESAVNSYQGGAFEYLPKPIDIDELVGTVRRAVAHGRELAAPRGAPDAGPPSAGIIGQAPAMQDVFRAIGRLAHSNVTVLIHGASGTGKELVANALHRHSPQSQGPLVALNMAAIPKELIETELFGHEKGAFTGAGERRIGRFEQADGGTLFLDEIGDMPADAQTRLLRVLADGEFYRVGGRATVRVDVRVIAATHQDLDALVAAGAFREDLFHRLNVIRIRLPRLAERRGDIPLLARHFIAAAAAELGGEPKTLLPATEAHLCGLPWPGNVRQLQNACLWLQVMAAGRDILVEDLPPDLKAPPGRDADGPRVRGDGAAPAGDVAGAPAGEDANAPEDWRRALAAWARRELAAGADGVLTHALAELERTLIGAALEHTGGHKGDAARRLGYGRNTLTRKLGRLRLPADCRPRKGREG